MQPLAQVSARDDAEDEQEDVLEEERLHFQAAEAIPRQAQKATEDEPHLSEVLEPEEDPTEEDHDERVSMSDHTGKPPLDDELLQQQEQSEVQAPEDVVPTGPMPHARQEPHDEDVAYILARGTAAPAKGDVHVVPKEAGQRYVPPPPELLH